MSAARFNATGAMGRLIGSREALNTAFAVALLVLLFVAAAGTARAEDPGEIERYDREMLTSLIEAVIAADEGETITTAAIPEDAGRPVARAAAGSPVDISPRARPDVGQSLSALPDAPRAQGFALQLASFTSAANAQRGFEAANARYASALDMHTLYVQPVDLGDRGVFHRLRIGGFESLAQAVDGCRDLGISIAECMVVAAGQ